MDSNKSINPPKDFNLQNPSRGRGRYNSRDLFRQCSPASEIHAQNYGWRRNTTVVGERVEHRVALQIDYIRLGDRHIALTGEMSNKTKIDKGAAVATTALFGLTSLSIMLEDQTGVIALGTGIEAFVAEDFSLPVISPAPASASPVPQAASHNPPR